MAAHLPDRIEQRHTADYRTPDRLPAGAVLVVGSAQSGCQIAEDLLTGGRRVILATSAVGRAPWRHRGRDTIEWLSKVGFFDHRPRDLPDPSIMRAAQPIVAAGGRSLSLQALARAGATLAGRPVTVTGERLGFDGSTQANIATGDMFASRIRAMVDEVIRRRGEDLPPIEPDDTDDPVDVDPPASIDLRNQDVNSVVWCTGFSGDFSWLPRGLVDGGGLPLHADAAAPLPGIWYAGLRWLCRRSSAILFGFPGDTALVAEQVEAWLGNRVGAAVSTRNTAIC